MLQRSVEILEDEVLGTDLSLSPLYESIGKLKKAAIEIRRQIKVFPDLENLTKMSFKFKCMNTQSFCRPWKTNPGFRIGGQIH